MRVSSYSEKYEARLINGYPCPGRGSVRRAAQPSTGACGDDAAGRSLRVMSLLHYRPAAPLDRFVECFWWSRRDVPQTYEEHMLPSGRAQLVIPLHETPLRYRRDDTTAAVSWS